MKVKCFVAETMDYIATQINEACTGGVTPTLGIVFASINFGIVALSEVL
jgi:hypothetical protein